MLLYGIADFGNQGVFESIHYSIIEERLPELNDIMVSKDYRLPYSSGEEFDNIILEVSEDNDRDGVPDLDDQCQSIGLGEIVDHFGCSITDCCPCDSVKKPYNITMESNWKNILKIRMRDLGITQQELAESIGVNGKLSAFDKTDFF